MIPILVVIVRDFKISAPNSIIVFLEATVIKMLRNKIDWHPTHVIKPYVILWMKKYFTIPIPCWCSAHLNFRVISLGHWDMHWYYLKKKINNQKGKSYLPAHMRRLPLQNVLGERWWFQLVLIERKLVNHHRLTVDAGETHHWMGNSRRLREWIMNGESVHVIKGKTFFWHYSTSRKHRTAQAAWFPNYVALRERNGQYCYKYIVHVTGNSRIYCCFKQMQMSSFGINTSSAYDTR